MATLAGWSHVMLVANNVPAKSVAELVAYAKANPGKVTFGYGLGTSPQIVGKSFELAAGLDLINVPYKGGEQVRIDLLGGRIAINFAPVSNALPMIQEGKVRALAVTSAARDPELPDVPTFKESGFPQVGFDPDVWQAIVAPLGTPAPIVNKLNAEINAALRSAEVQALFKKLRFDPMINSPAAFATIPAVQAERWPPIIKAAGLKARQLSRARSRLHDPSSTRVAREVAAAVRQRQIGLRAHLDQARGRALELLRLETVVGAIERVRLGRGRGDELHRIVVERVDQDDEALGLVALPKSITGMRSSTSVWNSCATRR